MVLKLTVTEEMQIISKHRKISNCLLYDQSLKEVLRRHGMDSSQIFSFEDLERYKKAREMSDCIFLGAERLLRSSPRTILDWKNDHKNPFPICKTFYELEIMEQEIAWLERACINASNKETCVIISEMILKANSGGLVFRDSNTFSIPTPGDVSVWRRSIRRGYTDGDKIPFAKDNIRIVSSKTDIKIGEDEYLIVF